MNSVFLPLKRIVTITIFFFLLMLVSICSRAADEEKSFFVELSEMAENVTFVELFTDHIDARYTDGSIRCSEVDNNSGIACTKSMYNFGVLLFIILCFTIMCDIGVLIYNATREEKYNPLLDYKYIIVGIMFSIVINIVSAIILLQFDIIACLVLTSVYFLGFRCNIGGSGTVLTILKGEECLYTKLIAGSITKIPHKLLERSILREYKNKEIKNLNQQYNKYMRQYDGLSI